MQLSSGRVYLKDCVSQLNTRRVAQPLGHDYARPAGAH